MNTKDKILKESIILFAKNGYEGTSMTTIAQKVGIEKPSLYAHYKSKKEIFECCLEEIITRQVTITTEILTDSSLRTAKERLYHLIKDCSKKVGPSYYSFYYRFLYFPPEELKSILDKQFEYSIESCSLVISSVIDLGFSNGEFDLDITKEEIFASYNCLMNGISYNTESYSELEFIWKIFWRGIEL